MHAQRAAAKRSYPTSEVRGSGRKCQTSRAQEQPRGATPRPRSEGAAERRDPASEVRGGDKRSYPASKVTGSGWEEIPHALKPEARGGSGRSYPTPEARNSGREDQPHTEAGTGGPRGAIPS